MFVRTNTAKMVEVEFKMELSDYLDELSRWLKQEWKIVWQFMGKLVVHLYFFAKNQYLFLRQFKYTKENITAHLLQKAARFFGMDLNENERKRSRRNKPFKSGFRLNNKSLTSKSKVFKLKVNSKYNKKSKKNRINIYRAPE